MSVTLCAGLCMLSGCAMTRNAWKNVHTATCGEPTSHCHCSCAECSTDAEYTEQNAPTEASPAATPVYPTTPVPPEGSRPIAHGIRPQAATMNGMPGTWIPSPHTAPQFEFEHQTAVPAQMPILEGPVEESYAVNPTPQMHIPPQSTQWPVTQVPASCPPDTAPQPDALKEYRTQVQVLSEQISQMKSAQDSIRASQETLQESHSREILELKLQQATADRDRMQRERELEQQLEKQRQRELETIDSLSQIIDGVIPGPSVSNGALVPAPRSATLSRQAQSTPSQALPTVDESH